MLRCKSKKSKENEGKILYHCNLKCVTPNMECMEVCDVQKFYAFTTVETYFLSPNRCETQITKNYLTSK